MVLNNSTISLTRRIAQRLARKIAKKHTKATAKTKPIAKIGQLSTRTVIRHRTQTQQQSQHQQAKVQHKQTQKRTEQHKKQHKQEKKKIQSPKNQPLKPSAMQQQSESEQQEQNELAPLGQIKTQSPNNSQSKPQWYFSQKRFKECELSEPTQQALSANKYQQMTHIQARTLPYLLKGRDVLGSAKTGSGKTLAYLIPCFQLLHRFQFKQQQGTAAIVITPTRELAIQVYQVAKKLGSAHRKTIGLLIGGMNRKTQSIRLQKGVNLLICTPGRLLDHLQNSKFVYHNLLSLVIDQADALLRQGFEQELNQILKVLPKSRQTILFSATQTQKVDELARLSLREPIYIGVDDQKPTATVQNLEQGFVVVEADRKFQLLFSFLQRNKQKKIMVFFSSCNSVKFFADLLNYVDIPVMDIHGKQKQQKRSTTFYQFGLAPKGTLLCTDVAARGLDIPAVDWIVQFDPPLDIKEYIHRVGRTCRGSSSSGKALLLLLPQEKGYLKHLVQAKVELNHYQFSQDKIANIASEFKTLIEKNHYLHTQATSAFKSYLHAYTTYALKEVFNVHSLDLAKVAAAFGLKKAPHVELNVKLGGSKVKKFARQAHD